MERKGFKGFNANMVNRYGEKFEEGKTYHVNEEIGFGVNKYGYHFCENIEDVFRYLDCSNNINVARITATGQMIEGIDNYNGYYDMYSAETIRIDHIMSRDEIILEILSRPPLSICRFICTGFRLTKEEEALFRSKFAKEQIVNEFLDYYYLNDKEIFEKKCKLRK